MIGTTCLLIASALASGPGSPSRPAPLPPRNAEVLAFARSNLGKPVGDGICITLAVEALRAAGARRASFRDAGGDYSWGEPVLEFKDVLPGDILQFRDAEFRGRRTTGRGRWVSWHQKYPHHTAIVSKVEQGGKLLMILHQNIAVEGQDESEKGRVQETELRLGSLQKGGQVKAYRPAEPLPVKALRPFNTDDDPGA